jgi:hypothetical protein
MATDQTRALVDELRAEGAPEGIWLMDIAQVRVALQRADGLLRRMENAIVLQATNKADNDV